MNPAGTPEPDGNGHARKPDRSEQLHARELLAALRAFRRGNFDVQLPADLTGIDGEIAETFNELVAMVKMIKDEAHDVCGAVGREGDAARRMRRLGTTGGWADYIQSVNDVTENLSDHANEIAHVVSAVAKGDLEQRMEVDDGGQGLRRGEFLRHARIVDGMVAKLAQFASEVTRVAREVGTEGRLGGQASVEGMRGTWKELTDSVNGMASNLTRQVRDIAEVTTSVARGDLTRKITVDAKGEILELKNTVNIMVDQLSSFADQVTRLAREVGVEGRLGGQADVRGVRGTWRDLTDAVNSMAANLTDQVRNIAKVASAIAEGDLQQKVVVEARGEIAQLKDTVNQMLRTLAETTKANQEQDWLKTNVARFTRMLQGQRDLLTVARQILDELAPLVNAHHGAFYMTESDDQGPVLRLFASYAYQDRPDIADVWRFGQGIIGQAALDAKRIVLDKVPPDYIAITSALGRAAPHAIVVVPILFEGDVKGVIELASFERFSGIQLAFLDQMLESLGIVIATIEATMRTDGLLRQSQSLTEELRSQQDELQQTNEELEEKAHQLTEQKAEVEKKNRQVELARQELEEKAEQLALTSKYKSQFLANMSHELRTPLNSLLILSRQLADNADQNLTDKQIRYAETIRQAGTDLMTLINEILDLAKIESGTMAVEIGTVRFSHLRDYVDQTFREVAEEKGLQLSVEIDDKLPDSIETDDMRLRQVLRNLLSNAIKFTERGRVKLRVFPAPAGKSESGPLPIGPAGRSESGPLPIGPAGRSESDPRRTGRSANEVIAFSVADTGIGIPPGKQRLIFEAFQQADGSTSRKYGGTGLGLAISRDIAGLLGGDLRVDSAVGQGSTFTLYLPTTYRQREPRPRRPIPTSKLDETSVLDDDPNLPPSTFTRAILDDYENLEPGDRVLLVVEDDLAFAMTILEMARAAGFKGVVSMSGHCALELARAIKPAAITLDLRPPDLDGWVLLDRLKHDSATRHIPVYIISGLDDERRSLQYGARGFVQKPITAEDLEQVIDGVRRFADKHVRQLLLIEDDPVRRQAILELIGDGDVETTTVGSGEVALQALSEKPYDCAILDLRVPGTSGFELLDQIKTDPQHRRLPVIVYTGRELADVDRQRLHELAQTILIKDVSTMERLLGETALFLHRVEASLPERHQRVLRRLARNDPQLAEHTVLVVDDDLRNIFALTSLLEAHRMHVLYAENGKRALAKLEEGSNIDIVLMDIMMPEMDGYEALRRIRERHEWKDLPVIAQTAKAMKGDREKCLGAGASDYITKPVDADQLLSLLRVWLHRA